MTNGPDDPPEDSDADTTVSRSGETIPQNTEWELVAQEHYDPTRSDELASVIIHAVAETEDVSPTDIKEPPLYEVVDTAALETAIYGSESKIHTGETLVEFMYRGYRISVQSDGWVLVHEQAEQ